MFCPNCGSNMPDDTRFCGKCGLDFTAVDNAAPLKPDSAQTEMAPTPAKTRDSKKLIAVLAAAVVIIAIVVAAVLIKGDQDKHAVRYASITVSAESFSPDATPIPLAVTGTDADGKAVNTTLFLANPTIDGTQVTATVELGLGDYTVSFPASPLTPDGAYFTMPQEPLKFSIASDVAPGATYDATAGQVLVLNPADLTQVTPEMIQASADYAIEAGCETAQVEQYQQALNGKRDQAIAEAEERKRQEEEARRRAEQKAKHHIQTEYYELDLPEYWWDKVMWETDAKGTTVVRPAAYPDQWLISITLEPIGSDILGGDIGSGITDNRDGSKGMRAEMRRNNWTYNAGFYLKNNKLPRDEIQYIVDLSSGVSNDLDALASSFPKMTKGSSGTDDFIEANVKPGFTVY